MDEQRHMGEVHPGGTGHLSLDIYIYIYNVEIKLTSCVE